MFQNFSSVHIPPLLVSTVLTFGGLIPFFNAEKAMQGFGLQQWIAASEEAQPVMVLSSARGIAIGLVLFAFYFRDQFEEFDLVFAIIGAYVGLADGYVFWEEGAHTEAAFRTSSGYIIAAWGLLGMMSPL